MKENEILPDTPARLSTTAPHDEMKSAIIGQWKTGGAKALSQCEEALK